MKKITTIKALEIAVKDYNDRILNAVKAAGVNAAAAVVQAAAAAAVSAAETENIVNGVENVNAAAAEKAAKQAENIVSYFANKYDERRASFNSDGTISITKRAVYGRVKAAAAVNADFDTAAAAVFNAVQAAAANDVKFTAFSNKDIKRICAPLNIPLNAEHCALMRALFCTMSVSEKTDKNSGKVAVTVKPMTIDRFYKALAKALYCGYNKAAVTVKAADEIVSLTAAEKAAAAAAAKKSKNMTAAEKAAAKAKSKQAAKKQELKTKQAAKKQAAADVKTIKEIFDTAAEKAAAVNA